MIVEEAGGKIHIRREGSKEMNPEAVGRNHLLNGGAENAFNFWMDNWSDIQAHLMTLFGWARGNILELGVRGGVSTSALLAGVERHGGKVWSVDFDPRCWNAFDGHRQWQFICADSCDFNAVAPHFPNGIVEIDVLFIDTDHKYERLKRELELWVPHLRPRGRVFIHDILSFPDMGKAAEEYARANNFVYEKRQGSNGLGFMYKEGT